VNFSPLPVISINEISTITPPATRANEKDVKVTKRLEEVRADTKNPNQGRPDTKHSKKISATSK